MDAETRPSRSPAPPSGDYLAVLRAVELTQHEQFGPGLRFLFSVSDGPWTGEVAGRLTGRRPRPGNACGRLLAELLGRPLEPNEVVDIDAMIGPRYRIAVEWRVGRWARVLAAMPADRGGC
jgi:hypothetical protein